jgi:hypothetical protein
MIQPDRAVGFHGAPCTRQGIDRGIVGIDVAFAELQPTWKE